MRKLMTSTIIILPLLLLAILLVSGAIMGLVTHIYVEAVEFTSEEAIVIVMEDDKHPENYKYNLRDEVTILPLKATKRDLSYINYDNNVISVSADGIITPKFYGETNVTVQSKENKAATVTRKVIVTDSKVHKLEMQGYATDLYEGESQTLVVSILPKEAEEKTIEWSSSDSSILYVGSNGVVTARKGGTATITATSKDKTNGTITATATITCHSAIENVEFDRNLVVTSQKETQFPDLKITPDEIDLSDIKIEYSSNNTDIANVDASGKITFKDHGKATITVKVTDYRGKTIEASKEFISTAEYFVGPLFTQKEILESDFDPANPIAIATDLEGACREIVSVECYIDGRISFGYIDEERAKNNFEIAFKNGVLPSFENNIVIKVIAEVFNFKTNEVASYEDSITISKNASSVSAVAKYEGDELSTDRQNPTKLSFSNIGESISLTIENGEGVNVQCDENAFVGVNIAGGVVTLTSRAICQNQKMYLSVGTKTYYLLVSIDAKADQINVFCEGQQLFEGGHYQTLLDRLNFVVKPSRGDGQQLANVKIMYRINNEGEWLEADVVNGKIAIETEGVSTLSFKCDDQEMTFTLQKTQVFDYGFELRVTTSNGIVKLDAQHSITGTNAFSYALPSSIQNTLTFKILLGVDFLGGIGDSESFERLFMVDKGEAEAWGVEYNEFENQIILTISGEDKNFNKTIKFLAGTNETQFNLSKVTIEDIGFTGFDSNNIKQTSPGLQQVRVFAKHSYYRYQDGDGFKWADVDYFKIPIKAISNISSGELVSPDFLTWKLSRYIGNREERVITTQKGKNVTYYNQDTGKYENYIITKVGNEWVLKSADDVNGEVISGANGKNVKGITWVDTYSEEGYARIYFGNFGGLSESDIYNNYFGAFDDDKYWETPIIPDDDKGRGPESIMPSANAYAFLRVEAGDGAIGGTNCHFNFNIVEDDIKADSDKEIYNIFDADGYYKKSKIVLHNNLYGPGELDGAGDSDIKEEAEKLNLFLDKPSYDTENHKDLGYSFFNKTIIYGNGNQVNVMQRHLDLYNKAIDKRDGKYVNAKGELEPKDGGDELNSLGFRNALTLQRIYNLTLKGSNPTEKIIPTNQGVAFNIYNSYYCDMQYIAKVMPYNHKSYIKNSVIRYASRSGYQLYYEGDTAYFEDVVFCESVTAISVENMGSYNKNLYFKGFYDILNYYNPEGLKSAVPQVGTYLNASMMSLMDEYLEWFGQSSTSSKYTIYQYRFINPFICSILQMNDALTIYFYDEDAKSYSTNSNDIKNLFPDDLMDMGSMYLLHGYSYNVSVSADGGRKDDSGKYVTRDMSELFSDNRYVRLLCEYKGFKDNGTLEKNTDHIIWHIQKVYRSTDEKYMPERINDHIEDLKNTLNGVTWEDGSGVKDGEAYAPAASISSFTSMFSSGLLPKKNETVEAI